MILVGIYSEHLQQGFIVNNCSGLAILFNGPFDLQGVMVVFPSFENTSPKQQNLSASSKNKSPGLFLVMSN